MAERNEYDAQAQAFLDRFGLKLSATFKGDRCPAWCHNGRVEGSSRRDSAHMHGARYRVRIRQGGSSITFDFWNSYADKLDGKRPTAYDVLACISGDAYCPDAFKDFCGEYGYDTDSRKAEELFRRCHKFAAELNAFFTAEELEALAEVQ